MPSRAFLAAQLFLRSREAQQQQAPVSLSEVTHTQPNAFSGARPPRSHRCSWEAEALQLHHRRSKAVPWASLQHHDSPGKQFCIWWDRDTRRGRDALFICAVPCQRQRYVFSIRIIAAKSRLPCGMGNLPKPLEAEECIAFHKWRVKGPLLISNYS